MKTSAVHSYEGKRRPVAHLGKPCVKGTPIPVYLLLEKMAAGETFEQLVAASAHR